MKIYSPSFLFLASSSVIDELLHGIKHSFDQQAGLSQSRPFIWCFLPRKVP